jgi:hypothetical protein
MRKRQVKKTLKRVLAGCDKHQRARIIRLAIKRCPHVYGLVLLAMHDDKTLVDLGDTHCIFLSATEITRFGDACSTAAVAFTKFAGQVERLSYEPEAAV